jgi:hypothetical protein
MSALNATWLAETFGSSATILNWNTVGAKTGALTVVAANAPLFAFRNSGSNIAWLIELAVAFNLTTPFSSPQAIDPGLFVCRAFSAPDSGGVQIVLSGVSNNGRRRTLQTPFSSCDMRVAAGAPLVAGVRTPDVTPVGIVEGWTAAAAGSTIPMSDLFAYKEPVDYPLVFAPGEGFEVQFLSAMGAGGVGVLYVVATLAEISGPSFPI